MKNKLSLILILLTLLFPKLTMAEGFMAAFEEIPLQDGLIEEEPFSYDTEELRIIEQYVSSSNLTKSDFLKFYTETLKSLGWEKINEKANSITFKREDESLTLIIEAENPLVVLFSLKPYSK